MTLANAFEIESLVTDMLRYGEPHDQQYELEGKTFCGECSFEMPCPATRLGRLLDVVPGERA